MTRITYRIEHVAPGLQVLRMEMSTVDSQPPPPSSSDETRSPGGETTPCIDGRSALSVREAARHP